MFVIFGTTNPRKVEDLQNIIRKMNLDLKVLSLSDIGWDRGEIEESGSTIEENSLLKANAIYDFCKDHGIQNPIITDDAGLFVDALNGRPGVYTARYADDEIALNPNLPKYQCVIKLLNQLNGVENRSATYRCCVTLMMPDGQYVQEFGESRGSISPEIIGELKRPYFYSVFLLENTNVAFNTLNQEDLENTYRYKALKKTLRNLSKTSEKSF